MAVPVSETGFDRVLSFSIPERDARGRVVRLGPVLDTVLSAHNYPPPIRKLLAEALTLVALVGALLKEQDSQLTMQAQSEEGVVDLLVCDYRNGELRGYVRYDAERLAVLGAEPTLAALVGKAYLAITFDLATQGQRYQGIVPLESNSLAEACQAYFAQSEQVPTLIRIGVDATNGHCTAGGLLIQHLPEGEEGRARLHAQMDHPHWEHVATLAGSTSADELVDAELSLEGLVWRLFHEEAQVLVSPGMIMTRGCRCTANYYSSVLSRFSEEDKADMRDDSGIIRVDCEFCSKSFSINL